MNQSENKEVTETKPRKARQPKAERRVVVYRLTDGKQKEQGTFPDATIGDPLERRLPAFLSEMFGPGEYKIDTRNARGRFEESFSLTIAESEPPEQQERIIDVDLEEFDDQEPEEFSTEDAGNMNATEVENLLLKERLRRLEEDAQRQKHGTQSEMQTLIAALEESRREQRELMMLMIAQAQKPQQDATTQAMNILEKSLGIVTKAKAISEEIAPQAAAGETESFMGGAARLIDSVGKNAGTFAPLLSGILGINRPQPTEAMPRPPATTTDGNNNPGELTELAAKIQQNGKPKESKKEAAKK